MRVPLDTVKALLRDTAMRRLTLSEHAFCPNPDCRVVYFTADGDVYLTTDIRVAVWQKEPFGARTVCYCFGENEADMRNEIDRTGTSEAVARVHRALSAADRALYRAKQDGRDRVCGASTTMAALFQEFA